MSTPNVLSLLLEISSAVRRFAIMRNNLNLNTTLSTALCRSVALLSLRKVKALLVQTFHDDLNTLKRCMLVWEFVAVEKRRLQSCHEFSKSCGH